ncbi:MAG TPA: cellulose biosynthesis protein BcsE [Gallionella sp.]|nr:cellulose biosynthesis protein BcsE [Gallionella sp.]
MREHLIGIKELPDVAGKLAAGRIYVVMHDAEAGLEMACKTLAVACASGRAEWVAEDPSSYLKVSAELGREVAECLRRGDLRIFRMKAGGHRGMRLRLLNELDFIRVEPGSLIVVEGVDRFVEGDAAETWEEDVAAWQRWAERTRCAVLWMSPRRAGQSGHEADFLRMAHRFSGIARLRKSGGEVRWDIYYWFASEGLMADKSFRLGHDGCGNWRVDEREALRAEATEPAVDEDDVFILRAALPGGRSAPGWRVFDTDEQMKAALSSARAPTVILNYGAGSPMEALARFIFELRRSIGPQVKIAVKEEGGRLRHSHEQLLLSVGANLVIPSETGFSRMQSLVKSIQGQVFARALPSDFDAALSGVVAVEQMGYLAPESFVGAVSEVMERSQPLEVNNALVRLFLTPGLDMLEALRYCTMKRPGDLCTADDESVYVFLFACEEQDISTTLDRLFRLPVSVLFTAESRFLSAEDVAGALAEFDQRASGTRYEDYTAALANRSSAEVQLPAGSFPSSAKNRTRAPFTAVPHALRLRATHV